MSPLTKKRFDYTWVIVACCFLMMGTSMGFCSSPKQLFVEAVTDVLDIPRSIYALNTTFRYAAVAIMNLFFGSILIKLGVRKMIALGFISLVLSNILYAVAQSVWVIYLGAVFLGIGIAMVGSTTVSYIIHSRCKNNVGTILGFTLAANGFCGAIAMKVLAPIIGDHTVNPNGYRNAYWLVTVILLVVGILVITLYKDAPGGEAAKPAKKQKKARGNVWEGFAFSEAKRKSYFIPTAVCLFLTGFVLSGINGISLVHMKANVGVENQDFIVSVWAFHSLALMFSKFVTGFIYDKRGLRVCFLICQGTAVIVMTALALVNSSPFGLVLAVIYAIFSSLALPMETVGVSLAVGDIFGSRDFAKILGLMTALVSVGFAVGDPIMNAIYDIMGSYTLAIWIAVAAIATVSVSFQVIITVAHKDREKTLAQRAAAAEAAQPAEV